MPIKDSKNCNFGGGNDYVACRDCGVEYDYRKELRPPCGGAARRAELIQKKRQIEDEIERLYAREAFSASEGGRTMTDQLRLELLAALQKAISLLVVDGDPQTIVAIQDTEAASVIETYEAISAVLAKLNTPSLPQESVRVGKECRLLPKEPTGEMLDSLAAGWVSWGYNSAERRDRMRSTYDRLYSSASPPQESVGAGGKMSNVLELRHMVSTIKALCMGDADEHGWARHEQTTRNRMRIRDICDDAIADLATSPPPPVREEKNQYHDGATPVDSSVRSSESGWQLIETAPRDGTHILIAFGEDGVSSAMYCRDDDDAHPWKCLDQQGLGLPIYNGARDDKYGPTHWMPLPNPPLPDDRRQNPSTLPSRENNNPPPKVTEEEIARVLCCPTGCLFVGDSEDQSRCFVDTSDYQSCVIQVKACAILSLINRTGKQT